MADQTEQLNVLDPEPASSSVGKQWRSIMNRIIFAQRFRTTLHNRGSLPRQGELFVRIPVDGDNQSSIHMADQNMNEQQSEQVLHNRSERHPSSGKSEGSRIHSENGGPSPSPRSTSYGNDGPGAEEENEFDFTKSVHQALVEQLNTHGVVLTLLASITFVVFLQPPGSLDNNGIVRSTTTVQCFLFFSSVSFMLACAGLLMVGLGSASLLHPRFFPDFDKLLKRHTYQDGVVFDSVPHLCKSLLKNLQRVKRLRMYMGLSFLACITAFIFAGLAITESTSKPRRILIAGTLLGGLPLAIEILKYLADVSQKKDILKALLSSGSLTKMLIKLEHTRTMAREGARISNGHQHRSKPDGVM